MPTKRRADTSALQAEYAKQQDNLSKHEALWRERWDSISDPFHKVEDMNSPAFRAQREAVLAPWRAARAALSNTR